MDEQSIRLLLKEQFDSFTSQSAKASVWPRHGSGSNDQGAQSRLLQKGTVAQYQSKFEKLMNLITDISEYACFEDQWPTTTIAKPNDINKGKTWVVIVLGNPAPIVVGSTCMSSSEALKAGSEKLAKTNVQGDRLKEAQNINRSFSALGDVRSALASKSAHIPYKNSKLTHLVQDSLGGDSKTVMYVQISPSEHDMSETLSSLYFATRVRGVELGQAKKQIDSSELHKLTSSHDKAKQDLRRKEDAIKKVGRKLSEFRSEDQVQGSDAQNSTGPMMLQAILS
ncbi:kinesin-like protein KIN-14R [Tanacetum coccineum]